MVQTKRWTITYTKHLTQKRKVYHDGALEVSGTCDKVMLYDDCENLIASRFLKPNETVQCGTTLAFGTHLVDVGEAEGDNKPQIYPNGSRRDTELNGSSGGQGQKENKKITSQSRASQNYSNTIDSNTKGSKRSKPQSRSLHANLNVISSKITVGNETKLGSSGVPRTHQDATETTRQEWNALYTTQKTQKAKKYHDGVLRLAGCGSHMNQVILLDDEGAVLSSKFLKSVERVGAGWTYEFANYLVEIGEPRVSVGDDRQKAPLGQVASSSSPITRKFISPKKDHKKSLHNDDQKKVPLGQLGSSSNSNTRKFTTTATGHNKKLPYNEYTQKDIPEQVVGCGSSIARKRPTSIGLIRSQQLRDGWSIPAPINKPLHNELTRKGNPEQAVGCGSSNAQKLSTSMGLIRNGQLRDACQIISILKKPLLEESFGPRKLPVEDASSLCSSDSIQMVISTALERNMSGTTFSKSAVLDNHKCDFQEAEVRVVTQGVTSAMPCLSSKTTRNVPTTGITLARENEDSQPAQIYPTSSSNMSRTTETEASAVKSDVEYTGSGFANTTASATLPKSSDSETCPLLVTTQKNVAGSVLSGGCSREVVDNASEIVPMKKESGIFSNVEQCTADSSSRTLKEDFSVDGATGTGGDDISSIVSWVQFFAETTEVEEQKLAPSSGASLLVDTAADPSCMDLEYQGVSNRNLDIDNIPSFDLGF